MSAQWWEVDPPASQTEQQNWWDDDPVADQALQQKQEAQPRSFVRQVAESPLGTGEILLSGGTNTLAAVPAGLAGLATMGANLFRDEKIDAADVVRSVRDRFTYEPRTQSAQEIGERIATAAQWVDRKALTPVLARIGEVSPTAENVVRTGVPAGIEALATVAPLARVPGAAARAAATRTAAREAAQAKPPAPTTEQLKKAAQMAYQRAEQAGVVVKPESIEGLQTRIVQQLTREGIDPALHPATTAAVRRLSEREGPLTLERVETMRRVANEAQKAATQPADRRLAAMLVDELDDFIDRLGPQDIITGDAQAATQALRDARNLWSRARKAEFIEELIDRAQTRAGAHYTQAGMEHALRQEFKTLALNKRRLRMFTPMEQAAIKSIARGGNIENILRNLGKFDPTSGGMAAFISAALGGGLGGLAVAAGGGLAVAGAGGVAVPAIGIVAKRAATRMTARKVDQLQEMMRRGPEGSVDPAQVMAAARAQPQTAPAAPHGPVAALPPPSAIQPRAPDPMIVDSAGRVAKSQQELQAYRQDFGIEGLRNVRQPQMREAPEREATAAMLRGPIEFRGDELGSSRQPLAKLRRNAAAIARLKFVNKTVTNAFDGAPIHIPWTGIRHALSGPVTRNAALAITRLDEILERGVPVGSAADRLGRPDILAVHYYDTQMIVAGKPVTIRSVVREQRGGRLYYDHFEVLEGQEVGPAAGGAQSRWPVPRVSGPAPTGQEPGLPQFSTGEHIVMSGRDVSRRRAPIEHIEVR